MRKTDKAKEKYSTCTFAKWIMQLELWKQGKTSQSTT